MASVKTCVFLVLVLAGWQLGVVFGDGEDGDGDDDDQGGDDDGAGAEGSQGGGGGGGGGGQAEPSRPRAECTVVESSHQVLLMTRSPGSKTPSQIRCSGSLIHRYWVLTAASCDHTDLVAVLGTNPKLKKRDVYVIKKKYTLDQSNTHNIMLMRLDNPLLKRLKVYPLISMPTKGKCTNPVPNKHIHLIGWKQATNFQTPGAAITNVPSAMCGERKVTKCGTDSELCTEDDGSNDCKGDCGGALIYDGLLYGIVKAKVKENTSCSIKYSSICFYQQWIDKTMKENPK